MDNSPSWRLINYGTLRYNPRSSRPWEVVAGPSGAGHSFETPREALAYAAGRGFLAVDQIAEVAAGVMGEAAAEMKASAVR